MRLTNDSIVQAPLEVVWAALNDVERIAPFVPGFTLLESEDDSYSGTVKVKVGAVTVSYAAEIRVLERNLPQRRVVMEIAGRERRGPGSMNASVTSALSAEGDTTRIALETDVVVTGRVAQFGAGILNDVSTSLISQFVAALEEHLQQEAPTSSSPVMEVAPTGEAGDDAASVAGTARLADAGSAQRSGAEQRTSRSRSSGDDSTLDVTAIVGGSVLRRSLPPVLGALVIAIAFYLLGRRG